MVHIETKREAKRVRVNVGFLLIKYDTNNYHEARLFHSTNMAKMNIFKFFRIFIESIFTI